ncbi:MAG TPA: DUF2062 domain-containing protein [Bacillota bacterium]|nr:DUF2062 domain-containing protein [Peptococcaceae bacterium MAG4]HPU35894.1 DUF2062 domain-containing protein [Bacillota bacterium]HPZ42743.1 DUF2062 domain-containing protein [Bacillota bacterium]HQD75466.1 DUF2062 domain-containing protein [Bacillota bacterium]HUM58809.1 DUF2062 domain-containing protein [Bacillota bacterium]
MKRKITSWLPESICNYYKKVMEMPDSPKKIARGVALGLAFDFLPIPVISIPLSYLVARLTNCSPAAAVATVVVFKLAVPVFFTLNFLSGRLLLGDLPEPGPVLSGDFLLAPFLNKIMEHGYPFLVGSLINATLIWFAVYTLLMYLLKRRSRHRST